MPHLIATYRYADGSDARRDEVRPAHREYLDTLDGLLLSGATRGGDSPGAVLVLEAGTVAEVEGLLDADPFTVAGVVAQRSVVEWTITSGRARERL